MAELNVGKHCQIDSCKQKDFLPFVCDSCSGVFCLEHRSRDSHSCPEEDQYETPRAITNVVEHTKQANGQKNIFITLNSVRISATARITLINEVSVKRNVLDSGVHTLYPCTFQDCNGKELLPVTCQNCQNNFCFVHRHQEDHKCEKLETPKHRMVATQELVQKIVESKKNALTNKGRKGAKNSVIAAKVTLMKIKLHATGDKSLPQTERTYFQVFLPKDLNTSSLPMFFSSKWSVGKVVDYAAVQASLKNNNNMLTAKKLRLCHPETGEAIKMDTCLQSLLSCSDFPLYNGGNIILEYLDNESSGVDVTTYIST